MKEKTYNMNGVEFSVQVDTEDEKRYDAAQARYDAIAPAGSTSKKASAPQNKGR